MLRKRLHVALQRISIGILAGAALICLGGCSDEAEVLAPFRGDRPLTILNVTHNDKPDVQWVGGRVAAVGVNRGTRAALDETLVWMVTASGNDIGSYVTVGIDGDAGAVETVGGTVLDSLSDDTVYTFWLAEESALAVSLDSSRIEPGSFADTTMTLKYLLRGRSNGDPDLGVEFTVVREQTLLSDTYTVTWTPAIPFRRLAIRQATTGGFSDLVWHVVVPDGEPDSIVPPVVIGEVPPGTVEATEWAGGFEPDNYVLWAVTSAWNGEDFGFRTGGYAFFQIFSSNFE